jgi:DNA polymerase III subunit epsilon
VWCGASTLCGTAKGEKNNVEEFLIILLVTVAAWLYSKFRRGSSPVDISHLPERFVIFDLETTGLDFTKHQIIEIGAIRVHRDSNVHDGFQRLIYAKRKLPNKIVQLTGITDEMLAADGVPSETALRDFAEFVGDLHLVSYNAEFDLSFLRAEAQKHGITFRNSTSCALKMARRAYPGRKSYRLADFARDGNLSTSGEHRALKDCERALIVYLGAASRLKTF